MDALPVGNEWDGWINFFDFETDQERADRGARAAGNQPGAGQRYETDTGARPAPADTGSSTGGVQESFDDDIPF